jgi:hypothetical protein
VTVQGGRGDVNRRRGDVPARPVTEQRKRWADEHHRKARKPKQELGWRELQQNELATARWPRRPWQAAAVATVAGGNSGSYWRGEQAREERKGEAKLRARGIGLG